MSDPVRVLLVGAGHTHARVLRRWADEAPPGAAITVVTDRPQVAYSGMIPGVLAGEYAVEDALVDVRSLARRAGARCVVETVTRVEPDQDRVLLADGTVLRYDLASLDVGSTIRGLDGPGAPPGTVPARDVDGLTDRSDDLASGPRAPSVVVVGAGAGGVEVAAALRGRLGRRDPLASVTLLDAAPRVLEGYPEKVSRRVRAALEARGVQVRTGSPVRDVEVDASSGVTTVVLDSGERHRAELTVWATGAAPPPLLQASGLPTDDDGFVRVGGSLRVRGHPRLFAAGDCASLEGHDLPKAGVHAVRQAPVLAENLRAVLEGADEGELRAYEPQSDFLTLLNLGDGTALGTKWGLVAEGRWVRWIKDVIDRRHVDRLRV